MVMEVGTMAFDAKNLSTLDRVVAGGGAVAFIAGFLPWYGTSGVISVSVSGWSAGFEGWFGTLLLTAGAVYLVLRRSGVSMPSLPFGPAVTVAGASVIGLALVILRWLTLPRGGFRGIASFHYGPKFGIWIAMIAGVVEVVGSIMEFRASGENLPWAQNK
jgi:hypothetical protein